MWQRLFIEFSALLLSFPLCAGIVAADPEPAAPRPPSPPTENHPLAYYAASGPTTGTLFTLLPSPNEFLKAELLALGRTAAYEHSMVLREATQALGDLYDAPELSLRKDVLLRFLAAHPAEAINIGVLRYYFLLFASEEKTAPTVAEFEDRIPPWPMLTEPEEQTVVASFYMDQAWQAGAESRGDLAREYYKRAANVSWSIVAARPTDVRVIHALNIFSGASQAQGIQAGAECVRPLKTLITDNPVNIPSWAARSMVGYISATNGRLTVVSVLQFLYPHGLLPDEHRYQYDKVFDEFYASDVVVNALDNPNLIQPLRTSLRTLVGNAYFNIDDWYDAETEFYTALRESEHQVRWEPRHRDVELTRTWQTGTRDNLGFALAIARHVQYHAIAPERAVAAWQEFIDAFPTSPLVANALIDKGRVEAKMGRIDDASASFERIVRDHPDSGLVTDAEADAAKLGPST